MNFYHLTCTYAYFKATRETLNAGIPLAMILLCWKRESVTHEINCKHNYIGCLHFWFVTASCWLSLLSAKDYLSFSLWTSSATSSFLQLLNCAYLRSVTRLQALLFRTQNSGGHSFHLSTRPRFHPSLACYISCKWLLCSDIWSIFCTVYSSPCLLPPFSLLRKTYEHA